MESHILGLVLDSSALITAERKKQPVPEFIEAILTAHGMIELSLSPIAIAELVHGIYRANTAEIAQRRRSYVEELISLVPVHPVTTRTAWLVGQISAEEAVNGTSCLSTIC